MIGWPRNHFDIWARKNNLHKYDYIFCSSDKACQYFEKLVACPVNLLPLGCKLDRFTSGIKEKKAKVVFVGNRWAEPRGFESLPDKEINFEFEIYGNGWEKTSFAKYAKGPLDNDKVAQVYQEATIVIDAANDTTKEWESVNSRIFNAIACGALPITDSAAANKLFRTEIPSYTNAKELVNKINFFLQNEQSTKQRIQDLQSEVEASHSYQKRGLKLQLALRKNLNISIKSAAPNDKEAGKWGDTYFAQGIKKYFARHGHSVRIDNRDQWYNAETINDDLTIVLHGLGKYEPTPNSINYMWVISHPEIFEDSFLGAYDHIFFASQVHFETYKEKYSHKVSRLLQCTDPEIFYPRERASKFASKNLFIGNSRNIHRKVVKLSQEANIPIEIIGGGWEKLIPSQSLKSIFAPYKTLPEYYSNCEVLLNDHWEDMIEYGYVSNRIFDAGACGAIIVTDKPKGIEKIFDNKLNYFDDGTSLKSAIDDIKRKDQANMNLSLHIRNNHSFEQRVNKILKTYYSI